MTYIRRLILALALSAGLAPAVAQVAPPVPALPDTERRTSYSISASTCSCAVGFSLFGDSTDVGNWIEVWVNGVRMTQAGNWTLSSATGTIGSIPLPITNAVLTFTAPQTGTIQIVGARRPRRTSQFNEGAGVPTRNFNVVLSDLTAQNRELWDKTNDVTGRALLSQPGNTVGLLPLPSACQGKFLGFDATGLIPLCNAGGAGSGNVVGPASSTVGHLTLFNNTTGTLLSDSGVGIGTSGAAVPLLNTINTWAGAQSYTDGSLILLGLTSGSSTLKAPATGGGTASLFPGTDTIAGLAATQTLTNKTLTSPFISQIFGGTAAGSSVTVQSTNNGAPSADVANLFGSTVNIGNGINASNIINLGGSAGGGVTVNIANAGNGLNALNVFNGAGGKQVWIPGPGSGTTPGTITFPAATDQLVARNTTDTLTNKTINGGSNTFCLPNRQTFTTGTNATYTTPTCNSVLPTRIEWEMVGAGGGGAGSGTTPGVATAGANTCVNTSSPACTTPLFVANGGALGSVTGGNFAAGGTATGCDLNLTGSGGGETVGNTGQPGGGGGASFFAGAGVGAGVGSGPTAQAGGAASANTGSGGGGASSGSTANNGGGGGAGGYCRKIQTSPASSYFYTVGAAGAAGTLGTSGAAGGAAAAGLIIATAYWQ